MWGNPAIFHRAKSIEKKNINKRYILTKSIDRSILIDPRKTNVTR